MKTAGAPGPEAELQPGAESVCLELRDGTVYKYLHPGASVQTTLAKCNESHRWPELNPQTYDPVQHCIVSTYVEDRHATAREARQLQAHLEATGRGYLRDIHANNVRVSLDEPETMLSQNDTWFKSAWI